MRRLFLLAAALLGLVSVAQAQTTTQKLVVLSSRSNALPGAISDSWFSRGIYRGNAATNPFAVTRAAPALASNSTGAWTSFAANTARVTNLGLLVEGQRLNHFINTALTGEVDGQQPPPLPGYFPTASGTAVTSGSGTVLGLPYIDMHWSGTGLSAPNNFDDLGIGMDYGGGTPVVVGQTWTYSTFNQVISDTGTLAGGNEIAIGEYTNGSPHVFLGSGGISFTNASAAGLTRFIYTRVLNQATVGYLDANAGISTIAGTPYDQVRRIAAPNLEFASFASSPILSRNLFFVPNTALAEWTPLAATQGTAVGTAPDGTATANSLIEDSSTGFHRNRQTVAKPALVQHYTYSIALQNKGRNIDIAFTNQAASASADQYFNLSTNASIAGPFNSGGMSIDSASIVASTNGFSFITITLTTDASTSLLVELRLNNGTGTNPNYLGNGTSGIWWNNALLKLGTDTSAIPNLDDRIRDADVVKRTIAGTSAGSVFVQAVTAPGLSSGNQVLWQWDDGTENNKLSIYRDNTGVLFANSTSGGVSQATLNLGSVASSATLNVSFAWAASNFAATVGPTVVTSASGSVPSGLTTDRLGGASATGSEWFGTIARRGVWNTRQSNGFLQSLALNPPH